MSQASMQTRWNALLDELRLMRETKPVHYDEQTHLWNLYRYEDVVYALSHPAIFSSDTNSMVPQQPEISFMSKGDITQMDPPRHRQFRNLISQAFTPRVVEQMAPRITALTNQLLDAVTPRSEMDIIRDIAAPLPIIVIAELLGVPSEDRERFKHWSNTLIASASSIDPTDEEMLASMIPTMREMHEYLRNYVHERRQQPREDLISRLTTAQIEGKTLDDDEIVGFASLLLLAGNITTTILIGNAVLCLTDHPEAAAALRADMSLLPSAIEEVLRFRSPFTLTARVTTSDITLHGVTIPARQLVNIWLLSANHDERQFPDPEHFDIRREPNRHQAFGHGIHFCIGAPLARLEGKIVLQALLERFPTLQRVPNIELEPHESSFVTGVRSLPVMWS
jgi:cytochrome P450